MHTELIPRKTVETEVFPEVNVLFKIKLKDEEPPCTLLILYVDEKRKFLDVYISTEIKEPKEGQNQGHYVNVSK